MTREGRGGNGSHARHSGFQTPEAERLQTSAASSRSENESGGGEDS